MNILLKTKVLFMPFLLFAGIGMYAQSGNHVFSGAESTNFGTIDLATPEGKTWSTDRSANPGYFSAIGTAIYANPSNDENVNGYVKHYANTADQPFNFPVGTGTDYRSLAISVTRSATNIVATAWIVGDPTSTEDPTDPTASTMHPTTAVSGDITSVSNIGQWDWQDITNDAAGATITVSIPDVSSYAIVPNLRLVGWNGSAWIDLSAATGATSASGTTVNSSLVGVMQSGITAIGIGSVIVPLAISLVRFEAVANDCTATLSWTIASEETLKGFDIETSTDARNFKSLGFIPASANKNYSFSAPMQKGNNFYRLRMIELDDNYTYSYVRQLNCNNLNAELNIYPNPASGMVSIENMQDGLHDIILTNVLGQQVMIHQTEGNFTQINIHHLPAGNYMVSITNGAELVTKKLVKQ